MRVRASFAILVLAVALLAVVTPCVVIVIQWSGGLEPAETNGGLKPAAPPRREQSLALLSVARFRAPPSVPFA